MNKAEFLKELRKKLEEGMTSAEIEGQIRYYSGYIDGERVKGRSEQEVLEELGDPVLLARTLLDTRQSEEFIPEDQPVQQEKQTRFYGRSFNGRGCLMGILAAAAIICVLFWLVGSIFRILAPVLVPVLLIVIIVSLWKKR
ncbi:MAG: DUF1700 domain-containing protein [Ruminococcus sp.]|jgi:uncharacterized membrane protein